MAADAQAPHRVDLQLAPQAHVTEEMRTIVLDAMTTAGIKVSGWVGLPGELDPTTSPYPIAPPSLDVLVSGTDPANFLIECRRDFAAAFATIRAALPGLPLGIATISGSRRKSLGFGPTESPAGIKLGFMRIAGALELPSNSLGWDGVRAEWFSLFDKDYQAGAGR